MLFAFILIKTVFIFSLTTQSTYILTVLLTHGRTLATRFTRGLAICINSLDSRRCRNLTVFLFSEAHFVRRTETYTVLIYYYKFTIILRNFL